MWLFLLLYMICLLLSIFLIICHFSHNVHAVWTHYMILFLHSVNLPNPRGRRKALWLGEIVSLQFPVILNFLLCLSTRLELKETLEW